MKYSSTVLGACLLGLASLLHPSVATDISLEEQMPFSTLFTKVTDKNGTIKRYIDLSQDAKSFVTKDDNRLHALHKVQLDPLSMELDFGDTSYAESLRTHSVSGQNSIDLTGTLFTFEDGSKTLKTTSSKAKVVVDNDALMEKYQFVYDYAPRMWLSEKENGWWPGSHQEFFDHMEGSQVDYKVSMTTRQAIKKPWDHSQQFLHGHKPKDGKSFPIHTFILPVEPDTAVMDPLEMLLNPEESTIEVAYIYFMPYDFVWARIGLHVGDIEKTKIQFKNGEPTVVRASWHDWEKDLDYSDGKVEKFGKRPVVYNARGTHATYFNKGLHPPIMDWTWTGERWDFWNDLDVVFPWDWTKKDRKIETDSNLNGINYLTQIYQWGNQGMGPEFFHQRFFKDGPFGYLNKFLDRQKELTDLDYVCEGDDKERCPWPMGVFSDHMPLCAPGYTYSYLAKDCFQTLPETPQCATPVEAFLERGGFKEYVQQSKCAVYQKNDCGDSYQSVCQIGGEKNKCRGTCVSEKPNLSKSHIPHHVCVNGGKWVNAVKYSWSDPSEFTFKTADDFKCKFELY